MTGNINANYLSITHIIGNTGKPTAACGLGAGAGPPTPTITGTDLGGAFSFTSGTTPTINIRVITITFAKAYNNIPRAVLISPLNDLSSWFNTKIYVSEITATSFAITSAQALVAATKYAWCYIVVE